MVYHIMCRSELVADVILNRDTREIHFEKYAPDGWKQPFSGTNLTWERFYSFLKSRCYEDGRADLKRILAEMDMQDNNPYEWVKKTHGVTWEDYFWIRIDDEKISWEDVRVRE